MKTLFTTVLDELYKYKLSEMLKRDYCRICKYGKDKGECTASNLTKCPVVQEQIAILEAGLLGIKEFKQVPWLDLDEKDGE